MGKGLPWFKFFATDWLADPALRSVSIEARGLWIDMLCIMHTNERRGFLEVSKQPVTIERLARMVGGSVDLVNGLVTELRECGVCRVTGDGVIYSKRMASDEEVRQRNARNGSKGGNPKLRSVNPSDNRVVNPPDNPPLIPRDQISETRFVLSPYAEARENALATAEQGDRIPDWWPACKDELDKWSRAARDGNPMQATHNEPQQLLRALRALEAGPPIDAAQANGAALVDLIRGLAELGKPWKGAGWVTTVIRGEAESWRTNGRPAASTTYRGQSSDAPEVDRKAVNTIKEQIRNRGKKPA